VPDYHTTLFPGLQPDISLSARRRPWYNAPQEEAIP
jgi:hypothetical protein